MTPRVLVAEDDVNMRRALIAALAAVGVEDVVGVGRGDHAISLIFEGEFSLLVLDWYMPGLAGLEITRIVRATGSEVPIIMVTGETRREPIIEAIQAGVSDYLIKPFDHAALLEKLSKYCHGEPVGAAETLTVAGRTDRG